jgi:hypothetical protein
MISNDILAVLFVGRQTNRNKHKITDYAENIRSDLFKVVNQKVNWKLELNILILIVRSPVTFSNFVPIRRP